MTHYDNVVMPTIVRFGSKGGPFTATDQIFYDSAFRSTNRRWAQYLRTLELDFLGADYTIEAVLRIFEAVGGPASSFLCRDWSDWNTTQGYMSVNDIERVTMLDQPLMNMTNKSLIGDGVTVKFQLLKKYQAGSAIYLRKIYKPQPGTVVLALNGALQDGTSPQIYDVNVSTGVITFDNPPPAGVVPTWGGAFYIPVAFTEDTLPVNLPDNRVQNPTSVKLREQRIPLDLTTLHLPPGASYSFPFPTVSPGAIGTAAQPDNPIPGGPGAGGGFTPPPQETSPLPPVADPAPTPPVPGTTTGFRGLPTTMRKGFSFDYAGPYFGTSQALFPWQDFTDFELDHLRSNGIDTLRVWMSDAWDNWWQGPNIPINPQSVQRWVDYRNFVLKLQGKGFTVVLSWLIGTGKNSAVNIPGYANQWREIATFLKNGGVNPDLMVLETANEPIYGNTANDQLTWKNLERQLIDGIRQGWSTVWISTAAAYWDALNLLITQPPHLGADGRVLPRVMSQVHYYRSMGFTHQGLPWVSGAYFHQGTTHYTSSGVGSFEGMSRAIIDADMTLLSDWADKYGIPIFVGEFGTGSNAPFPDSINWIQDVRESAETHRFGWAYWTFAKSFNACTGPYGQRVVDADHKKALGLA